MLLNEDYASSLPVEPETVEKVSSVVDFDDVQVRKVTPLEVKVPSLFGILHWEATMPVSGTEEVSGSRLKVLPQVGKVWTVYPLHLRNVDVLGFDQVCTASNLGIAPTSGVGSSLDDVRTVGWIVSLWDSGIFVHDCLHYVLPNEATVSWILTHLVPGRLVM